MNSLAATDSGARAAYPTGRHARDRFVLSRRPARQVLDPFTHQGVIVESERAADGACVDTATVFLTGRECPWRCVMCDLWTHTIATDTPAGAIPAQIASAVATLWQASSMPTVIKLYNAGSFFDRRAVPPADDDAITKALAPFDRVIVESHPSLIGDRTWRLRDGLAQGPRATRLEVAMGLETAHADALERLNKGITVESFAAAARALTNRDVDVRVFLLIHPPFVPSEAQDTWLARSVATAFACGATAVSLIPTRGGNGAMEALRSNADFAPPSLMDIERSAAIGRAAATADSTSHRRVFVDTWDLPRVAACTTCVAARVARLTQLNLDQRVPPALACDSCGEVTPS